MAHPSRSGVWCQRPLSSPGEDALKTFVGWNLLPLLYIGSSGGPPKYCRLNKVTCPLFIYFLVFESFDSSQDSIWESACDAGWYEVSFVRVCTTLELFLSSVRYLYWTSPLGIHGIKRQVRLLLFVYNRQVEKQLPVYYYRSQQHLYGLEEQHKTTCSCPIRCAARISAFFWPP